MKKISGYTLLFILCIFMLCRMPVFAWGFSDDNYYGEEYYGDEPDISDGDLEDKLGDWGLYEDMFPEEVFAENFYDSGLSSDLYDEWYDEYERSGLDAETFIEKKREDAPIGERKAKTALKERICDFQELDASKYVIYPNTQARTVNVYVNGEYVSTYEFKPEAVENSNKKIEENMEKIEAKGFDPNKEPYLKGLCEQYGEDLLATVEIYYNGKPCRYNKETKMFVPR